MADSDRNGAEGKGKPGSASGKAQKGVGSRDSRRASRNKNLTSALPDRGKDRALEVRAAETLQEQKETSFTPQEQAVIDLQAQGLSFANIGRLGRVSVDGRKKSIVSTRTIRRWRATKPEFKEESEKALNSYIESCAQEALRFVRSMRKLRGISDKVLDDADKILTEPDRDKRDGMYKRLRIYLRHAAVKVHSMNSEVRTTLNIAGRRLNGWQENAETDQEVIVFDWSPEWRGGRAMEGDPGQGAAAAAARARWQKIRAKAERARTLPGGDGDAS